MNVKLSSRFAELESTTKRILDLVSNVPDTAFHASRGGKWSMSQILSHLIIAERMSLDYMKKKSLGLPDVDHTSFAEELKFLALKISQRLPLRYKAPPVLGAGPPKWSREQILQEWKEERSRLKTFLAGLQDTDITKQIYKHAVAGRLNAIHAVSFFNEHAIHHLPQIKALLKQHN